MPARPPGSSVYACKTIIENEKDALAALDEVADAGANAAVIYLGNFGPEGPLAIFAAAIRRPGDGLRGGRGDARTT